MIYRQKAIDFDKAESVAFYFFEEIYEKLLTRGVIVAILYIYTYIQYTAFAVRSFI